MTIELRPGRLDDLPVLTALYNHYVEHTPITFDTRLFSEAERRPWLEQFALDGPHRLWVALEEGALLGWACSMRFRVKAAYDTSVETSIYCAPDAVGKGLGRTLYGALFDSLGDTGLHRAYAGITLPNDASIALHERFGFRRVGVYGEVGFKLGRYWDVAWYERAL